MTLPPQQSDTTARSVDGHIMRGTRKGPVPIGGQWVLLHRVGPDHAGPLDSTRTEANGHYHMRYHTSGDSSALYFASTSYGGIAYFTSPLRAATVKGDDGLITVFDTTSNAVAIKLGGRHVIIGIPHPNGNRPVGEVYDLQNDSTVTLIARDTLKPTWLATMPAGALNFQLNAEGDLAAGAVSHTGNFVALFAPLSPGIRQLAFTYELPPSSFPLSIPMEHTTGVLELLIQEPSARVSGIQMHEMAPVSTDGRLFRRLLAQDIPANAVMSIDIPRLIGAERENVYWGVGLTFVLLMSAALVYAARRSSPVLAFLGRGRAPAARAEPSRADTLVKQLADLDANFERDASPTPGARTAYESKRAKLKAELAKVLAAPPRKA